MGLGEVSSSKTVMNLVIFLNVTEGFAQQSVFILNNTTINADIKVIILRCATSIAWS